MQLATSRSGLVRLRPVADALARRGLSSVFLDPAAGAEPAVGAPEDPPCTHTFAARRRVDAGAEQLMGGIEAALERLRPSLLMVADDSPAAVAAALVASKLDVPVASVGAGLRSDDWAARDEVARVVIDSVAQWLYTDSSDATLTLAAFGIAEDRIQEAGSTLADSVTRWRRQASAAAAWRSFGRSRGRYVLAALNRAENVGDAGKAARIAGALSELAQRAPVVLIADAHTCGALERAAQLDGLRSAGVTVVRPLGYVDFLSLELGAAAIVTDSAAVQEEATLLDVPCFTLRRASERTTTLLHGTNMLLGDDPAEIAQVPLDAPREAASAIARWDGRAARRIAEHLAGRIAARGVG